MTTRVLLAAVFAAVQAAVLAGVWAGAWYAPAMAGDVAARCGAGDGRACAVAVIGATGADAAVARAPDRIARLAGTMPHADPTLPAVPDTLPGAGISPQPQDADRVFKILGRPPELAQSAELFDPTRGVPPY